MRKIIAMICCVVLLCSVPIVFAAADDTGTAAYGKQMKALDMFTALGIVSDLDETNFDPAKQMTRGEFACLVAKLIRADEKNLRIYFYDVPANHYSCAAVAALVEAGVLKGNGEKQFYPDELITGNEAYAIAVRLLSYTRHAEVNGGYPTGYLVTANRLKLTGGSANAVLTMGDALVLLRQTLITPVMDINKVERKGENTEISYYQSNETLLSLYYDAYYNEGVVTAVKRKGVYGERQMRKNEIEIDGLKYTVANGEGGAFFGREVEYIYSERNEGDRILLWTALTGRDKTLTLDSDTNECDFNEAGMEIEYYGEQVRRTKVRLSGGATVIYNGENFSGDIATLFRNERYTLTLIATKNSSSYDICEMNTYDTFMVDAINTAEKKVYGDAGQEYSLDDSAEQDIDIYDASGARRDFSSIDEKNVLSIARSMSGETLSVLLSTQTVSGKIQRIAKNGSYTTIVVNDNEYKCFREQTAAKLQAGATAELYLDAFSCVYDSKAISGDGTLAYVINMAEIDTGLDHVLRFKLLTEDGTVGVMDAEERLRIDNVTYTDAAKAANVLRSDGAVKRQLIKYKQNSEGKVTEIDTSEEKSGLRVDQERKSNLLYKSNCTKMGTKIVLNADTKVFCVPSDSNMDSAADNEFAVRGRGNLNNDTSYDAESYVIDENDLGFANAVVIHGFNWGESLYWTVYTLINEIYTTINADGEIVDCIDGFQGETPVQLVCDSEYSFQNFKPGDIVAPTRNNDNYISNLSLIYRPGREMNTNGYANTFNAATRIMLVKANDKIGSVVRVGYESGADYDEIFNLGNAPILIFDPKDRNGNYVSKGSCGDVVTYRTNREECSDLFIQGSYGSINLVVIYKD